MSRLEVTEDFSHSQKIEQQTMRGERLPTNLLKPLKTGDDFYPALSYYLLVIPITF